jgi:hypothetical protein
MPVNQQKGRQSRRQVAFGLTIMAGLIAQSFAQEAAPAAPAQDDANMTVVQVSGYRNSLLSSAKDKKEAVGFRTRSTPKTSVNSRTRTSLNR